MNTTTDNDYLKHISGKENNRNMQKLVDELQAIEHEIRSHNKEFRNTKNKLLPRDKINLLIDKNTFFLELSTVAGLKVYDFNTPSAGIITGIGIISGRYCMIVCNDHTVKGGSYLPLTIKKHLRAQEIALENKLPCVYIVDSAGAFLPKQAEIFADRDNFGRIFYNQALLSGQGIAQIAVVTGSCTAGGAYIPAMSDESIMVTDKATIFLAGPALVKAAIGEEVDAENLGGAFVHGKQSGLIDHIANTEEEAFSKARKILATISSSKKAIDNHIIKKQTKIYEYISADPRQNFAVKEIICEIVDTNTFFEFKEEYGKTLICGFAKIDNKKVAIIANNGVLVSESALKACHFVQICDKRETPIIFLQNISGFMVGKNAEAGGIAKHGAALVNVISTSKIPKITIIIGGSYGAGNYAMCGRAFNPRFLWSWPNSKTAIMGAEQAADVMSSIYARKTPYETNDRKANITKIRKNIKDKYAEESSCYYTSARLLDDGIIDPSMTRYYIAFALDCISLERTDSTYGIIRT